MMATPSDHLSPSANSLPDLDVSGPIQPEAITPSTPPLHHARGDTYYNFPPARIPPSHPELSSSTTNINMQPNPMYQDFPPGIPLKNLNSEKQIVVEKIKEGNPDALSSSTLLENNVKVYERIDSIVPRRRSFLRLNSYSPEKKNKDSDYQYLGALKEDTFQSSPNITKICLQAFYSVLLIATLFIAVVALGIGVVCLLDLSKQSLASSQNVSYRLEVLDPLISMSSSYKLLADRIDRAEMELQKLRLYSQQSFSALNQSENCFVLNSMCLLENREQMCGTEPPLNISATDRITGIACVTSHDDAKPNIVFSNETSSYSCQCSISIGQVDTWSCSLYIWACDMA